MPRAALSITVWMVYVDALGLGLLLFPNVILEVFGVPGTDEPWIRILGLLLIGYGIFYRTMLKTGYREGFQASVWVRLLAGTVLVWLAVTTDIWQLGLFAFLDLAGATWTHWVLRADNTGAETI